MPKKRTQEPANVKSEPIRRFARRKKVISKIKHSKPGKVDAQPARGSSSTRKKTSHKTVGRVSTKKAAVTTKERIAYAINKMYAGTRLKADIGSRKPRKRCKSYAAFMKPVHSQKARQTKQKAMVLKKKARDDKLIPSGEQRKCLYAINCFKFMEFKFSHILSNSSVGKPAIVSTTLESVILHDSSESDEEIQETNYNSDFVSDLAESRSQTKSISNLRKTSQIEDVQQHTRYLTNSIKFRL